MKTIKIKWKSYDTYDVLKWNSPNSSWINYTNKSETADYTIHIDSTDVPRNDCLFLVEPKSIMPRCYDYAINNSTSLKYIISYDKTFFKNTPNFIHVSPPFKQWIYGNHIKIWDKTKNISFIASNKNLCGEHTFRQLMVSEYGKYCDVFGVGRNYIAEKIDGLRDYRYTFCMENHITDIYYTEKLLDCFLTGTVPIYFGTKTIGEIFDINGIIFLEDILNGKINIDDLTSDLYETMKNSIKSNFDISNKINNCQENSIDEFVAKIL